jgi:hypothetical protein
VDGAFEHLFDFVQIHIHEFFCEREDLSHTDTYHGIIFIRHKMVVRLGSRRRSQSLQAFEELVCIHGWSTVS